MKYLLLPHSDTVRQLPFYFAVEEYVARHYSADDYFFIWQVPPTVMLGRNQLIENEVNIDYCRSKGVKIFRRKSGGGCVYTDEGCLQFSYITSDEGVNFTFDKYIRLVAHVLQELGLDAHSAGRNDIVLDGKKIAGTAFYRVPGRNVLHNTLLYSTDLEELVRCITPSDKKLISKGIESVRQRVTNISYHLPISIGELIDAVRKKLCRDQILELTSRDMEEIAKIETHLASDEFVYGNNPKYTVFKKLHTEGVGEIEARIEVKGGLIKTINLVGDYFLVSDLDESLLQLLRDVPFEREAVALALATVEMGEIIRNLSKARFLRLLFGRPPHVSKPEWLKISLAVNPRYAETKRIIQTHKLHTICTSGRCPNQTECWGAGTATLMIAGDICTRCCRFCNTKTGKPLPLDIGEPTRIAQSVLLMKLKHVVITSVDRDDLPDMGSAHWAETITEIRRLNPATTIEVLIPDFQGRHDLLAVVLSAKPDIVAHNMETVRRLTPVVRSAAKYDRSLDLLKEIARLGFVSKTGLMVGLGETSQEVEATMNDLRHADCRIITIGQYLQPTYQHYAVAEYVTPTQFDIYKQLAKTKGFEWVESGPLVRSSYHAERYRK